MFSQSVKVNCAPRSEEMTLGRPCQDTQPCRRAMHKEPAEVSEMGITSGHLESLSMMVKRCVNPCELGSGLTTSTWMCSNLPVGMGICCAGGSVCLITFERWQSTHSRVHCLTCLDKSGQ